MPSNVITADLAQIAAALEVTTELLAAELGEPQREPPAWSGLEWRIATAASAMQGIAPLLQAALRWRGPEPWHRFLDSQSRQALMRYHCASGVLEAVDREARAAGLPLVALKGAALYARGVYAAGLRPMGDIDLLVQPGSRHRVQTVLEACGYVPAYASRRHDVYRPVSVPRPAGSRLGEHAENPLTIEVHTRIAEPLPLTAIDISRFLWPLRAAPGINPYPSDASLLAHLLLHAAGNMRARALRHVQLHDIALVAARLAAAEWDEALGKGLLGWWALPPLELASRYYGGAIPRDVLARIAPSCTKRLLKHAVRARVSDVSWSQMRIEAFPGIEWSRSVGEACGFMRTRIVPSRQALRELRNGAEQIPGVASVPWYRLSHAARVARWVWSKPPRVQTILSVRAALSGLEASAEQSDSRL